MPNHYPAALGNALKGTKPKPAPAASHNSSHNSGHTKPKRPKR